MNNRKDRKRGRMLLLILCGLLLTGCAGAGAAETSGTDPVETAETAEAEQKQSLLYELRGERAVITGVETPPPAGESLRLPEAIEGKEVCEIAANAFEGMDCTADTALPLALRNIGASAFRGSNIRRFGAAHIAGLSVGTEAFADCAELTAVSVNESNVTFGKRALAGSAVETISVSGGTVELGESAAEGCAQLTSVDISGNAILQSSCCENCKALTSFVLTDATEFTVGERAFAGSGLTHAVVRNSAGQVAGEAFADCTALQNAEFDEGLTGLGARAFAGCSSLFKVVVPASVTVISDDAFADCPNVCIFAPEGSYAMQYAQSHGLNTSPFLK